MNKYRLEREIPIEDGYDLVVAGGGPAGASAAISAGRLGLKVLLVEATGCLGGTATSGLVTAFNPMADGERMIVGGIMREIVETLYKRGGLAPDVTPECYSKFFHCWTPFRAEALKLLLDELVTDAKVDVLFFTRVIDADAADHRVNGVIINNIEGHRFVKAPAFVDATGNAELTALCGAAVREAGRDTPDIMPPTLCTILAGIDWEKAHESGDFAKQQQLLEQAIADGHFSHHDKHLPGAFRVGRTIAMTNAGHVFKMNALNARSLSDGMMRGRKLVLEYIDFYRKYIRGFENAELATTGAIMGIRESRRIVGEYELNFADFEARRKFPDQIGIFNNSVDIHVYDDTEEQYRRYYDEFNKLGRVKPGEYYGLPYGIIVPRGWKNLWVAGRCNSSDIRMHGTIRVQPAAAMMGEAAGTAAAQAIRTGRTAGDLDTAVLVESLRKAGAYLPQQELSKEMTRA